MNRIYRSIWNDTTGTFVAASENAKSNGKKSSPRAIAVAGAAAGNTRFALKGLAVCLMLAFGSSVYALPAGGVVSAGSASIASGDGKMTISQASQNVAINFTSINIAPTEAVQVVQPNVLSVALLRDLGSSPSSVLGSLSANGKVFLVNPNGILFAKGAQVNVGGLVASTRNITDSDFMAGNYKFAGSGGGTVVNQGSINADGGYVALLGASVSNEGVISARLGTVALAAGNAITLDVAGDGLLNVAVNQGAVNALVQNGGLIQADGGQVLLTALSASNLLQSAVNNTGVIQAQTVENHNGTIRLLGDMQSGTVNVGGTLDASAPNGGNGGFIETSAANVKIANGHKITAAAPMGLPGTWLIDPLDFTVGSVPGDNITGAQLSADVQDISITITTVGGAGAGNGDIFVTEAVTWNGLLGLSAAPTTLTLNAQGNVYIGRRTRLGPAIPTAAITPTNGSLVLNAGLDVFIDAAISPTRGNLVVCCGQDIFVNEAITTVNGSVLLSAGRDVNVTRSVASPNSAITTSDGNIELCAGRDVILSNTLDPGVTPLMTLTNGSATAGQDLNNFGVPLGLTLRAGNAASGPGPAGGTVNFVNGGIGGTFITVTAGGPGTPTNIFYNPVNYATPTNYLPDFTGTASAIVASFMLVYPGPVDKIADGTNTATFTSLQGNPVGVALGGPGTATYANSGPGLNIPITYSGFTLTGVNAGNFALPEACCNIATTMTGNITAAATTTTTTTTTTTAGTTGTTLPPTLPVFYPYTVLAGLDLSVAGITMPPIMLVEATPVEEAPQLSGFTDTPAVEVPTPALPPRPDRN